MAALEDMDTWLGEGGSLEQHHTFCRLVFSICCSVMDLMALVCLRAESAQVAIFDATNSTEQRRQVLVSAYAVFLLHLIFASACWFNL